MNFLILLSGINLKFLIFAISYVMSDICSKNKLNGNDTMCRLDRLQQMKEEILQIARRHNAEKIYVFGSCARKEETPESDIDLLAEFKPNTSLFDHAGLEYDLAELLKCKVDVVAFSALKSDKFAANIRREMVVL